MPRAPRDPATRAPRSEQSDEHRAAGDVEDDAGDPVGLVGGEEHRRLSDIVGSAETANRMFRDERVPACPSGSSRGCSRSGSSRARCSSPARRTALPAPRDPSSSSSTPAFADAYAIGLRRVRATSGRRRDRDDVAAAALLHPGQEALDRQERRREVRVDRRVPLLFGQVLDRPRTHRAAAGVRDHDVGRAEALLDACVASRSMSSNRVTSAATGSASPPAATISLQTASIAAASRPFTATRAPSSRETHRDRSADATRAPRDEGDAADERAHDGAPGVPAMKLYWIAAMRQSPSSRTIVNPTRTSGGVG